MDREDEQLRQREAQDSIGQILGSGKPLDEKTIMEAYRVDPTAGASLQKLYSSQSLATAKEQDLSSRRGVREAPMVAGALKMAFDAWKSKPPEGQTQAEWEKWKATGRAQLARNGLDPELLSADADPQSIEMQIGAGYAPGAQDLTQDRQAEMMNRQGRFDTSQAATQGRFDTSQAGMDARSQASIGAANQRASLSRTAADARTARSGAATGGGGGGGKQYEFDRTMVAAGIDPGTPEYVQAARLKAGLDRPSGATTGRASAGGSKQLANVQNKLQTIDLLKQQLQNVKKSFNPIKDTLSAGPGGNYIPTEGGQSFDAAVAAISPIVRQLTRTPGEGAMSDYEAKLAEAILPSRGKYESVTAQQIQQVEDMISQLESGYTGMLQQAEPAPAGPGPAATAGVDPEREELERLRAMKAARMAGR